MKEEFVTLAKFMETRSSDYSTDEILRKSYPYYLLGHFHPKVRNLTFEKFRKMSSKKFEGFLSDLGPLSDQEYQNLYCEFMKHD